MHERGLQRHGPGVSVSAPVGSIRWQLGLAGMTVIVLVVELVWWPVPLAWDVAYAIRKSRS